jgi:hypothetical protein
MRYPYRRIDPLEATISNVIPAAFAAIGHHRHRLREIGTALAQLKVNVRLGFRLASTSVWSERGSPGRKSVEATPAGIHGGIKAREINVEEAHADSGWSPLEGITPSQAEPSNRGRLRT